MPFAKGLEKRRQRRSENGPIRRTGGYHEKPQEMAQEYSGSREESGGSGHCPHRRRRLAYAGPREGRMAPRARMAPRTRKVLLARKVLLLSAAWLFPPSRVLSSSSRGIRSDAAPAGHHLRLPSAHTVGWRLERDLPYRRQRRTLLCVEPCDPGLGAAYGKRALVQRRDRADPLGKPDLGQRYPLHHG